jgi:hypothetical protein
MKSRVTLPILAAFLFMGMVLTTLVSGAAFKAAGSIESTTGGFVFPDGSVQTSAANTINDSYVVEAGLELLSGESAYLAVLCYPDDVPLSAGTITYSVEPPDWSSSYVGRVGPYPRGRFLMGGYLYQPGWEVYYINGTAVDNLNTNITMICMDIGTPRPTTANLVHFINAKTDARCTFNAGLDHYLCIPD